MRHFEITLRTLWSLLFVSSVLARCYDPLLAFPLPTYTSLSYLDPLFNKIAATLEDVVAAKKYSKSSFSVEITSSEGTIWSAYHTARERNESRLGAPVVDGESLYRIASITKTFTTLGILQQHAAGNLSLDDSILLYVEELNEPQEGKLPWKDITLRSLASQLSGIPREFSQADLINELPDPSIIGLPPATKKGLVRCNEYNEFKPCKRKEFLDALKSQLPLFAPNQKSTYSNDAFDLLGLVLENVTGLSYSAYIKSAIFQPLNLTSTSLERPDDSHAVLPLPSNFWDIEEGVERPTGGIYSSSSDMSRYLRYILTHYNGLHAGLNWLNPGSYSTGLNSFYGMPWEIYRTDRILKESKRPVTFVTKSGGEPGYTSNIIMAPEYDLGFTVLVGGDSGLMPKLRELVTVPFIRAAEEMAWSQVREKYAGTYVSTNPFLNTTITLTATPSRGLEMTTFISNSTDILLSPLPSFANPDTATHPWHAQLIPTLLFKNETAQAGEVWRSLIVPERVEEEEERVWDEFCLTDDDQATYAGLPINEVVFWGDGEVELPAFRVRLMRKHGKDEGSRGPKGVFRQVESDDL